MEKQKIKQEQGITLIGLIITIIILVILAAVSVSTIYNMRIVNYATNGTYSYIEKAREENKMMDSTANLIGDTTKKLEAIQGEVPDELKRYVMGAEGTGRTLSDIYASEAFKAGTEADIVDANTEVIYMNILYASNYLDTDYTLYIYAKYQDIGYKIAVTKNASTNNVEKTTGVEVVYVPNGMEGQEVDYSLDGTSATTKWLVLYDNGNTVDITPVSLGTSNDWEYTLGKTDPAAVGSTDLEKAQYSRVHMVENLNAKCAALVTNETAKRVRSIGTQFDIADTTEKYSSARLETWPTGENAGAYNGVGLVGDMNAEQDVVRMSYFSPNETYQKYGYANAGVNYCLASRLVVVNSSNVCFNARIVLSSRQSCWQPLFVVCVF